MMAIAYPRPATAMSIPPPEMPRSREGSITRFYSPISNSSSVPANSDMYSEKRPSMSDSSCAASSTSPEASTPAHQPHSTSLHFFIVDDPKQLKDKGQLKAIRQHVMHDYLHKERQKPASKDIRITRAGNSRKRKRQVVSLADTLGNSAPAADEQQPPSLPSRAQSASHSRRLSVAQPREVDTAALVIARPTADSPRVMLQKPFEFADDIPLLIHGIAGGVNNSRYLRALPHNIPGPISQARLGSNIQPFNCWPTLADPTLNVEQLKWSCSRKFGTRGLSLHWVPALLKARHAFLSTICISATHDDIMMRGQQAPHERSPFGSTERMKVRSEILGQVNLALADPEMQTADATLIAVLHILNSEIMGCDDRIMRIHQNGLHDLVHQRGGLSRLGVDGQLASILTITMYIISALRETEPHSDYIRYAGQKRTVSPNTSSQIPESPLYCKASGYETLKRVVPESSPTFQLLQLLRDLTHAFVREDKTHCSSPAARDQPSVASLRDRIFALPSGDTLVASLPSHHFRYQYEGLRLSALVYSHALASRIPFSSAAVELSRVYNHSTAQCDLAPDRVYNQDMGYVSWHMMIKTALIRTNLSDCWGHLAGVLFFVTLIAGACGNSNANLGMDRLRGEEEQEGRTWLAAITVRCSIVLSFEFGEVVLEILKRLVGIQQVLGRVGGREGMVLSGVYEPQGPLAAVAATSLGMDMERRIPYGPEEMPLEQRTFADFARDFMDGF